jgi:hypothetical protein
MAAAPPFRLPRLDEATLDELVRGYEHITGDAVRRDAMRNYVAAGYRVHGDNFLPLVQRLFVSRGTAVNLLGVIRCLAPETATPQVEQAVDEMVEERPRPSSELAPGLTCPANEPPPFNPTSNRRYDRPPSHPDAIGFFDDDELGAGPSRSPTAEALNR